jgi:hypothetical protein
MSKHPFEPMSLWLSDRYGLVMCVSARELCQTGFNEVLFDVKVVVVSEKFETSGIYGATDWHAQFTRVT